ncbi:hypothetical protein V8E54_013168, partial [Elaphomyces granulatus]
MRNSRNPTKTRIILKHVVAAVVCPLRDTSRALLPWKLTSFSSSCLPVLRQPPRPISLDRRPPQQQKHQQQHQQPLRGFEHVGCAAPGEATRFLAQGQQRRQVRTHLSIKAEAIALYPPILLYSSVPIPSPPLKILWRIRAEFTGKKEHANHLEPQRRLGHRRRFRRWKSCLENTGRVHQQEGAYTKVTWNTWNPRDDSQIGQGTKRHMEDNSRTSWPARPPHRASSLLHFPIR